MNREVKFFWKFKKKKIFFLGGGGGGFGLGWGGVRMDVNEELKFLSSSQGGGVRVDVNKEVKFL